MKIKVKRLTPNAQLPAYMTSGAAGLDLCADLESAIVLAPGERTLVPTGIVVELPTGHEGQIRPRSGLAIRYGIALVNSPGTIDEDYRGEIKIALINLGAEPVKIEPNMRIAQMIVAPITRVYVEEVTELTKTVRSDGGFGHTG